jgi:hypothetical protein
MPRLKIMIKSIKIICWLAVFVLTVIILTACQGSKATSTRDVSVVDIQVNVSPTMEPYVFKTSQPGKATVHGVLIVMDPMTLIPAPDDAIYLVPLPEAGITTIPQFEEGTVPQADVDERTGEFVFTDIGPGQYAVVVRTKGGSQIPARDYDTHAYSIFTIDASLMDTVIELGNLSFP